MGLFKKLFGGGGDEVKKPLEDQKEVHSRQQEAQDDVRSRIEKAQEEARIRIEKAEEEARLRIKKAEEEARARLNIVNEKSREQMIKEKEEARKRMIKEKQEAHDRMIKERLEARDRKIQESKERIKRIPQEQEEARKRLEERKEEDRRKLAMAEEKFRQEELAKQEARKRAEEIRQQEKDYQKKIWWINNLELLFNGEKFALHYQDGPTNSTTRYIYDDVELLSRFHVRLTQKRLDGSVGYGVAAARGYHFFVTDCDYTKVTPLDGYYAVLAIDEDGDEYAIDDTGKTFSLEVYKERLQELYSEDEE